MIRYFYIELPETVSHQLFVTIAFQSTQFKASQALRFQETPSKETLSVSSYQYGIGMEINELERGHLLCISDGTVIWMSLRLSSRTNHN